MYQYLIASHNSFCGCNYCEILKDYVKNKKALTSLTRYLSNENYPDFDSRAVASDYYQLHSLRSNIKILKAQKDNLKTETLSKI